MKVDIDPATLEQLEALEDRTGGVRGHQWTPEEDAILLAYWPSKRQKDVAAIVGMCSDLCRERYRKITHG